MAAGSGGNVEGSKPDEVVVTDNGVTIIGDTDLATKLPTQASQLYGQNLVNLMKLLTPEKDGQLVLDLEDAVQRGMTVAHDGEVMWPPPQVSVSAARAAGRVGRRSPEPKEPKEPRSPAWRYAAIAVGLALLFVATAFAPPSSP